ncbi:Cupredoxin [Hortaea werneckii]|nr:Cupredoxin [Hortaea werneckii]
MPPSIASSALLLSLAYQTVLATPFTASSSSTPSLQACADQLDGELPSPTPLNYQFSGNVRRYYVAAEEVEWDYAPTGWDNWLGVPFDISPRANAAKYNQFGSKWLKALYRGYTDSTFSQRSEQPAFQGTQGPTIRSEVGDLIEIMFVNNLSDNYATMHSMGLAYNKAHGEGADYPNNTSPGVNVVLDESNAVPPMLQHGVEPGGCVVYKWMVPENAGPNNNEPVRVHSYHSFVALQQDTNAGLIGPQIVYAKGQMEQTMATYREFPLLYMIYDESDSWLSAKNQARLNSSDNANAKRSAWDDHGQHASHGHSNSGNNHSAAGNSHNTYGNPSDGGYNNMNEGSSSETASGVGTFNIQNPSNLWSAGNYTVWHPQLVNLAGSGQWSAAPSWHTMNGYVFSNNPPFEMCLGDKAIWYVNGYGSASHVFHMHGHSFTYHGFDEYAVSINDGVGKTLYMNATEPGLWQVLCHVNNHQTKGMVSNYNVYKEGKCPTS